MKNLALLAHVTADASEGPVHRLLLHLGMVDCALMSAEEVCVCVCVCVCPPRCVIGDALLVVAVVVVVIVVVVVVAVVVVVVDSL